MENENKVVASKPEVVKEEIVSLGALEINATSPKVEKRLKELNATKNILKDSGIQINNVFYGYAMSEHKKVLIAKATADYQ